MNDITEIVKIPIRNGRKTQLTIDAIQRAIDGKPKQANDDALLTDSLSILRAIKEQAIY